MRGAWHRFASGRWPAAQARTEALAGEVGQVRTTAQTLSQDLADVALTAQTSNRQILRLSEELEERQALDPEVVREIQEPLRRVPEIDVERLAEPPVLVEPPAGGG